MSKSEWPRGGGAPAAVRRSSRTGRAWRADRLRARTMAAAIIAAAELQQEGRGPLGHADQRTEPRGRHARLDADHLAGFLRGPRRAQAPLGGLLPHPQLHRGLTEGLGQLGPLGLELLLPRPRPGLADRQARIAGLEKLALPV